MKEYLIRNGTIFDGSGADRYVADVWLKNGRIAAIGDYRTMAFGESRPEFISAVGKYVTPGFIDSHSHADVTMAGNPGMDNYLCQGITTLSVGHCGMGVAPVDRFYKHEVIEDAAFAAIGKDGADGFDPYQIYMAPTEELRRVFPQTMGYKLDWTTFGEYLEHMKKEHIGCNIKPMVSFGSIRMQVMGEDCRRPATKAETEQMKQLLLREIRGGARGFHAGLDYLPDCYASEEELLELVKCLREPDLLFDVHTQNQPRRAGVEQPDYRCMEGVREVLEIGLAAGVRTNVSHLVTNWPSAGMSAAEGDKYMLASGKQILAMIENYERRGLRVTFDVIPPNCMCMLNNSCPEVASLFYPLIRKEGGKTPFLKKLQDPEYRREIRRLVEEKRLDGLCNSFPPYRRFLSAPEGEIAGRQLITRTKAPDAQGETVERLRSRWNTDGLGVVFRLLLKDPDTCWKFPVHQSAGDTDCMYIRHRLASIGFDGTAADFGYNIAPEDFPLNSCPPGNFNAMAQYLTMGIFERFEDTVYKATGRAAKTLRMEGRGLLKEGYCADVVVLDPIRLKPQINYVDPTTPPLGIDYVWVNGVQAVEKGRRTPARAGVIL